MMVYTPYSRETNVLRCLLLERRRRVNVKIQTTFHSYAIH